MKNKAAFSKIQICFLLSCLVITMTGCTNDTLFPNDEMLTESSSEKGMENTEEFVDTQSNANGGLQHSHKETVQTTEVSKEAADEERIQSVSEIYYAYHTLDEADRKLYLELLDALQQRKKDITVSTVQPDTLKNVFTCVMSDHPELFYVDGYQYTKYTIGNTITRISFFGTYSMTEEEIRKNQEAIDAYVSTCLSGMPKTEDEYDKVKYLYDYLIEKTEYDKEAPNNQNICSVFIERCSVCQGYAKALQYLMQKAGMVSTLITGYTGDEGHAWNLVRVNGAYYYIDVTWGDASYTFAEGSDSYTGEIPPINYDYFLVTTKDLCVTHQPDYAIRLPECIEEKDNYYVREGLYLTEYSEDKLKQIFEQAYAGASGFIMFKCSDEQVFDIIKQKLIDEQAVFRFISHQGSSIAYTDNREQRTISFWI